MPIYVIFGKYLFINIFFKFKKLFKHICAYRHGTSALASYKVTTLSEYQVCRELLWMLYIQTSMVVFQQEQENESKFSIRPDISIPSLTTVNISQEHFGNF